MPATFSLLHACGFAPRLWRDRSEALKTLMASLIMEYGSAATFWEEAVRTQDGGVSSGASDHGSSGASLVSAAWSATRPGYYMLVAEACPPEEVQVD